MIGRRLQRAPSFLEPYGVRAAISVHRMHVCDIVPHPRRTTMLPSRIRITYRLDGWRNQQRGYTRCVYRCALSMGRHTTMLHDEMCDTQLLRLDSRTEEKVPSSSSTGVFRLSRQLQVFTLSLDDDVFTLPVASRDYYYSRWRERVLDLTLEGYNVS